MKLPGVPPEAAWPVGGPGCYAAQGPAGSGLGRRPLVETWTFLHLRPRTFRSGWPICTWLWFGLSRQREATGHSLNASSESKYLSAFQEENPPEENSMTEGFVPRGLDMDA